MSTGLIVVVACSKGDLIKNETPVRGGGRGEGVDWCGHLGETYSRRATEEGTSPKACA